MNKADAVNIIEVDEKLPLFKGDILADKVELIRLKNIGFDIVAQKGLYNKGEDVIYIQPDYCLPDTSLFGSYIRPNGDESKSMLGKIEGKPRRIRAKKFNLSLSPNGDPIYSNGILLPYDEVYSYLYPVSSRPPDLEDKNLTELLGITKYEEPEYNTKNGLKLGQLAGKFPESVYKTDEENIHNLWNHIENKIGYPVTLVGTEKIDGCFPYFQKINMFDGSTKRLFDLKSGDIVQGFDHVTNKIIPSKVIAKTTNGKTDTWYSLTIKSTLNNVGKTKTKLFVTPNHKVFSNGQYTEASSLKVGDKIIRTINEYNIPFDVLEILKGKLLGDGSMDRHNASKWSMTFGQNIKQKDYLLYLRDLLGDFVTFNIDKRISGYGSEIYRSRTKHTSQLNYFFKDWYINDKKQIPNDFKLTPLSLCFWYLDDGNLQHNKLQKDRVIFSICSFDENSCKNLSKSLLEIGFSNFTFFKCKRGYQYLRLQKDDTVKLMELIHIYVPECMQYKLTESYRNKFVFPTINRCEKQNYNTEGVVEDIKIIDSNNFSYKTKIKYDIETETHNFFAGETLVHNSSISIGITPKYPEGFICSRNFRKKLTINKVVDRREPNFWEIIKSWFGIKPDLNIYQEMENDDDFVKYGKPYLKILLNNTTQYLVLRGELNGGKLKGSGNKNNPASKEPANIKLFGIDKVNEYNEAEKMPYRQFKLAAEHLGFPTVKEVFVKEFNSKEELLAECNNYFKQNMVEGIVVRTLDSKFSAKVMNSQYDSLK